MKTIDEAIRVQSEKMEEIRAEMTEQKIGLMSSIQNGLGRVNSAIDALSEQYPTLYKCSLDLTYLRNNRGISACVVLFDTEPGGNFFIFTKMRTNLQE